MKIKIMKERNKSFKPETSYLRLSNFKARKILKWKPKWSLNHTLDKIIEWNKQLKKNNARDLCINQISDYLYK